MRSLLGVALGAVLMYLFDPERGRARRTTLRDRAAHGSHVGRHWARRQAVAMVNRARGLLAETRGKLRHARRPPDNVLLERVRAELGHVVRHPRKVDVTAEAGWIELHGKVLPGEKVAVINAVRRVRGVFGIEDHLDEFGWINGEPVGSDHDRYEQVVAAHPSQDCGIARERLGSGR